MALGAVLAASAPASAHPHEWIEMKVEVLFSQDGTVSGMRHDWRMDPYFSAFALEDVEKQGGVPTASALTDLGNEMLGNISQIDYFIKAHKGMVPLGFDGHELESLAFESGQLRMTFTVSLDNPVQPATDPFTYKIYDPEFYIELIHVEGDKPVALKGAPKGCSWVLEPPEDNQAMAAFAGSLGQDQSPGMELGAFFAEEVSVSCK